MGNIHSNKRGILKELLLLELNFARNKSLWNTVCVLFFLYPKLVTTVSFVTKWIDTYNFIQVMIWKKNIDLWKSEFSQ